MREREDGVRTLARLKEAGLDAALLPLSEIVPLRPAPPPGPFRALVATSRHAVPWLARHFSGTDCPVLAVGEATAGDLRQAGFADIIEGQGRAGDLVALAKALAEGEGAAFLYAAGRVRLPELEAGFAAAGLSLQVAEVYDTRPRAPSEGELARLGLGGPFGGVLLLSRGQAQAAERLVREVPDLLSRDASFFCLSEAIALELSPQFGKNAVWAARPTLASLIEAIHRGHERPGR
ncbi:uroporphyrinogen-III synthase [Aureimonas sp. AU40]|uniref:uroporphyrinogen-III synthase n=1 Tax=Aureimonas sp. AU40 TaxID=1637747 RepID=UPI0007831334|nr:uroporphyrinogen-III synthase [Aureimonas sp. AU40]